MAPFPRLPPRDVTRGGPLGPGMGDAVRRQEYTARRGYWRGLAGHPTVAYRGMLPCFLPGTCTDFVRSISSAWAIFSRVSRGSITSSM